jgi:polyisoprenoid-binding protein YceI
MKLAIPVVILGALLAQDGKDFEGTTYHVGHNEKFVNITFESEADLETIVGTVNVAKGQIKVNFEEKKARVSLEVPVDAMKTGIDLRDEHLRGKWWLDAARFPVIRFESTDVKFDPKKKDAATITGLFSLHGVSRELSAEVRWRKLPADAVAKARFPKGEWIKFTVRFDVRLSDHGVKIPGPAIGKVSDTWTVKMAIYASTAEIE